ncbi:ABC transporter ATP-binding protein [Sporolactobacillus shoreicorticis]|uniref:ABC transporter ATP-binding protein n=1 Tax=Sporolactobacillus shoreicorticis TaxID=1923877 RepID=A0ABW5S8K6_9BACL|nr:ABC transporter ATP-binding protein [Sporolactobacillus shoreicorticis]MCO7126676.1 ABC transporter ATP-binding protein [Sporolactobacillus shoreicorticis]
MNSYYPAVDNITMDVFPNEVLAIVGESGCGKSALALSIMGLHNKERSLIKGHIYFQGTDLLSLSVSQLNKIRGKDIGMIFQDPLTALNPLMRVGQQIEESMNYHTSFSKKEKREKTLHLLEQVGIPDPRLTYNQFPHELSGGMRQRVVIAIAIACEPALVIADEPTTALDVTIQAQIMELLKTLQKKSNTGIILITHDLGVVSEMADRVAVMYAGQIVELSAVEQLFNNPLHPYTRSLLNSIPSSSSDDDRLHVIQGIVPSLQNIPRSGCRFSPRIPWIDASHHEDHPVMHEVESNHWVRCSCYKHFYFPNEKVGEK